MSETTEQIPPEEQQPAPAPAEAPETPSQTEPPPHEDHQARRWARMTTRISAMQRERDEFAQRLAQAEAHIRQMSGQHQPQPPPDPQLEAYIEQRSQQKAAAQRTQERIQTFHEAGRTAYPDWSQRCNDLQAMGADPGFAELLVEMPQGHKVAAALRDDPEELERIASLQGERARAIALGNYAARLDAQPTRSISRAPAPPRPVQGRVATAFVEQQANMDQLLDFYSKQAMERRRNGQ
jgi:hypothetical protein